MGTRGLIRLRHFTKTVLVYLCSDACIEHAGFRLILEMCYLLENVTNEQLAEFFENLSLVDGPPPPGVAERLRDFHYSGEEVGRYRPGSWEFILYEARQSFLNTLLSGYYEYYEDGDAEDEGPGDSDSAFTYTIDFTKRTVVCPEALWYYKFSDLYMLMEKIEQHHKPRLLFLEEAIRRVVKDY